MNGYDLSEMVDALPQQAAEILRDMGVSGAQFGDLFTVSFRDVLDAVLGIARGGIREPLAFCFAGCGVLLLLSLFAAAGSTDGTGQQMRTFTGALFLITACAVPLHGILSDAVSAVRVCSTFLCTLIPILAAVLAAAGNPVLSVVWHTAVFTAAQTVAAAASGFMAPCCGLFAGIGVLDSLLPQMRLQELAARVRKTAVWIFSAMATLFTAFLSLKGVLAGAADSLAAKGIKLAVSSFIPVIGPQLSEAYASVVGSMAAVRATAGAFAIAGVCAVLLPAAVRIVLWIAALRLLRGLAGLLDLRHADALFAAVGSALSVLHACLLFTGTLYVLCLGIILTIRTGV